MNGNGIMDEIRTLLSNGKASGEVIALGYRPPTVYKVQRQMRQEPPTAGKRQAQARSRPTSAVPVLPEDPDWRPSDLRPIRCSPPAYRFVAQVAGKTGLPMWEALDLLVACAIDDDFLESVLDTWDLSRSGVENAPYWLPLSNINYEGKVINL